MRFVALLLALTLPITATSQQTRKRNPKLAVFEGVVIEKLEGAQWYGIVVSSRGVKYTVELAGKSVDVEEVGDVTAIGAMVKVYHKGFGSDFNGTKSPNAVKVVRVNTLSGSTSEVWYVTVSRCEAGQFTKNQWQQAADKLRLAGIPYFFASHESLPFSQQAWGDWLLIRIDRRFTTARIDSLLLGPFNSKSEAVPKVQKLPQVWRSEKAALREDYPGQWSMGCFLLLGARTK